MNAGGNQPLSVYRPFDGPAYNAAVRGTRWMDRVLYMCCYRSLNNMRRTGSYLFRYDICRSLRRDWAQETVKEVLDDLSATLDLERLANMRPSPPQPFELMGPGLRDEIAELNLCLDYLRWNLQVLSGGILSVIARVWVRVVILLRRILTN